MKTVKELSEALGAKRDQMNTLMAGFPDVSTENVEQFKALNAEVADLSKELDQARTLEQQIEASRKAQAEERQPVARLGVGANPVAQEPRRKSFGDHLQDSKEYAAFRARQSKTAVLHLPGNFKTLLALTDINNVATRLPGIVEYPNEERTVADLMLQGTTDNNTLTYMEETTFTNSAATVSEGGTKPESALDFTERTVTVRKIATWLPATDELLNDVAGMRSYIEQRLRFMVERTEEVQLLTGNGTPPNLTGLLNVSGIQTQAKGSDPVPDAIYKAMTKIRNTGFAEPTGVVMHPNDWQDVKLLRTADGVYIWGNPSMEGPDRIWGLEVRITTAETENTALIGAFRPHAQIFRREGITVTISTEHSTYFVENKVAILAEERLALAVYRPTAFCTVTSI